MCCGYFNVLCRHRTNSDINLSSADDNRKCEVPLLPFVPYPTLRHSNQPMPCSNLRGLRPGQRLQLGAPMADPVTGVPVPILGVTIHPQSGLVYPLGGLYACPLTGLRQHIQMGSPFLDPRTGSMMLTTGVSLDPMTGQMKYFGTPHGTLSCQVRVCLCCLIEPL